MPAPGKFDAFLRTLLSSVGMHSSSEQEHAIDGIYSEIEVGQKKLASKKQTRADAIVIDHVQKRNAIGKGLWELARGVLEKKALGVWGREIVGAKVRRGNRVEEREGTEKGLEVRGQMGGLHGKLLC